MTIRIVVTTPSRMDDILCGRTSLIQELDQSPSGELVASVEIDGIGPNRAVGLIKGRGYTRVHALRRAERSFVIVGIVGMEHSVLLDELVNLMAYSRTPS